ncbi:MAG: TRAP transporter small permease subunit [Alphaproteobacteria bacterium]|nr:TRAP transporter small permease subunit [Alphaproteobacteria bacterium]
MDGLLKLSAAIDWLNDRVGKAVYWLVLVAVVVSAGNAVVRYSLNMSSNAWLEIQWYLFSAVFLLCAGYTFLHNEHIRIDIVSSRMSPQARNWMDVFGHLVFLLPLCVVMLFEAWPYFMNAFRSGEVSSSAGGLIRWPARLLIPAGFTLLLLQMVSELIKRFAVIRGWIPDPYGEKSGSH